MSSNVLRNAIESRVREGVYKCGLCGQTNFTLRGIKSHLTPTGEGNKACQTRRAQKPGWRSVDDIIRLIRESKEPAETRTWAPVMYSDMEKVIAEIELLREATRRLYAFAKDVTPQIGKLVVQDLRNLNEGCIAAERVLKIGGKR